MQYCINNDDNNLHVVMLETPALEKHFKCKPNRTGPKQQY